MQPSSYRFPDELRIDELTIRYPTPDDIETVAPAFVDPEVGGEAGLPPVGPEMLVAALLSAPHGASIAAKAESLYGAHS